MHLTWCLLKAFLKEIESHPAGKPRVTIAWEKYVVQLKTTWAKKMNSDLYYQGQMEVPKCRHWTCRLWFVKKPLLTNATLCTCLPGEKQERRSYFNVVNGSSVLSWGKGGAAGIAEEQTLRNDLLYNILCKAHHFISFNAEAHNHPRVTERRRPRFRKSKKLSPGHRIWTGGVRSWSLNS